jgi:hypothetical protein
MEKMLRPYRRLDRSGASHLCEWGGGGGGGGGGGTRTNGEKALILRALCARKMSALNEKMHKWDAPDRSSIQLSATGEDFIRQPR